MGTGVLESIHVDIIVLDWKSLEEEEQIDFLGGSQQ